MAYTFDLKTDVKVYQKYQNSETDAYEDPDAVPKVTITLVKDGTVMIDGIDMIKESTGIYYYWWETAIVARGIYKVFVEAEVSAHTVTESVLCELV